MKTIMGLLAKRAGKVTWRGRDTWRGNAVMYFRYAQGDALLGRSSTRTSKKCEFTACICSSGAFRPTAARLAKGWACRWASCDPMGAAEGLNAYAFVGNQPMVFAGLYPVESHQYAELRESLEKLRLNDSSFTYEPETSGALGFHSTKSAGSRL